MKKDNTRDYSVEAFRYYAAFSESFDKKKNEMTKAELEDILAVEKTYYSLKEVEKVVIEIVYFKCPKGPIKKNDISARVSKASLQADISEISVYRILRKAREKFSIERRLRM